VALLLVHTITGGVNVDMVYYMVAFTQ